jgi:membrane fusion protein, multidrug efflux system
MKGQRAIAATLAGWSITLLAACGGPGPDEPVAGPPPSVTVALLEAEPITETRGFVGRVTAAERVDLRARVQGLLQEVSFTEGRRVEAGARLFLIEPDSYQAVVAQRAADLERARAEAVNADAQLRRGEELLKTNAIARARVDELRAAAAVATASVAQGEAALNAAQLNLDYTEIRAPISGRIGLSRYTVGNLIGPDSGVLATLVQQDPVNVQFPLTQKELLAYRKRVLETGGDASAAVIQLRLADGSLYEREGRVDFVDVTVDQGTDTVLLRSSLPNPDNLLVPGQFVAVTVKSGELDAGVLVPQSALQMDQLGLSVLVLDEENRVQVRRITAGQQIGPRVVAQSGLVPGDRVVVEGIQKVRPGQTVTATPWQPPLQD